MTAVVYRASSHAYGEACIPPERDERTGQEGNGLASWYPVEETFHDRGVTIVWCAQIEVAPK